MASVAGADCAGDVLCEARVLGAFRVKIVYLPPSGLDGLIMIGGPGVQTYFSHCSLIDLGNISFARLSNCGRAFLRPPLIADPVCQCISILISTLSSCHGVFAPIKVHDS